MKMTEEGLALIRRFEGFRARAYRDAVGVWTIGYGHTSAAGAPAVHEGLTVTAEEAAGILARDVAGFAAGVAASVTKPVNDSQFSALVSFAYNVGLGNFRRSGVLAAVNKGDFEAVPRRLNLWVKAGGRVLPGLVKRRAEEGLLFISAAAEAGPSLPAEIEAPQGKSVARSRTVWASGLAAMAAVLQALYAAHPGVTAGLLVLLALAASAVVIAERVKKSREEGI